MNVGSNIGIYNIIKSMVEGKPDLLYLIYFNGVYLQLLFTI